MYKKNSWIVALLLALSFSIFFMGCINPLEAPPADTDTYTEIELTKFNAVGGNDLYQKGWGTDGSKDAKGTVKSIGLTVEMLQTAKYLVVEVNDGFPKNNFETIYDSFDADGNKIGDWQQLSTITSSAGVLNAPYGTREGNVLKLEMAKIIKNYSTFKDGKTAAITLLIQHWGNGGPEACIKSAKLLIPDTPPPFVSVANLSLVADSMYWTNDFELAAKVVPSDATNQGVTWAIQRWVSEDKTVTLELPALDPTIQSSITAYNNAREALFAKVRFKQEKYTVDETVYPNETALKDIVGTVVATDGQGSLGTLTVRALIKNGIQDDSGRYSDFTKSVTVQIKDPPPFEFTLAGAAASTIFYGAVDNGGVSGGSMELVKDENDKYTGYTVTLGGGYGNSHHYIELDLGSGKLNQYAGVRVHYKAVDGDSNLIGKTIRVRAMLTKPPREYNIGPFLSSLAFDGSADVLETDLDFKFFKDEGNVYDTDKTGTKNMPDPQTFNGVLLTGDSDFAAIKNASKVYIWFVPWSAADKDGKATKFTLSGIEFYKP